VLDWPGQIVLCTSSIFWTEEVTQAMKKENGIAVRRFG
jgi:dynein heavy chain